MLVLWKVRFPGGNIENPVTELGTLNAEGLNAHITSEKVRLIAEFKEQNPGVTVEVKQVIVIPIATQNRW